METEKNMTYEESLSTIQRMITTAKENLEDDSFYFLLWGWLVLTACILHYLLILFAPEIQGIGWVVLMPLGGLITMVYGYKKEKKQRIQSYINDIMKYVLISFLVSLFVVLFFMSKLGPATYPIVMLDYGMLLFVSGGALKFRPMIVGGIVNWVLGIMSFFFPFEQQLLILGLAVLLGYIIPGHMLKNKFRKLQNQSNVR
jgi:uncharacterized membrane protein